MEKMSMELRQCCMCRHWHPLPDIGDEGKCWNKDAAPKTYRSITLWSDGCKRWQSNAKLKEMV